MRSKSCLMLRSAQRARLEARTGSLQPIYRCADRFPYSLLRGSDGGGKVAMSDLSRPPFRADHVGSLLRPPELLRARAEHQAGRLSAEELRRAEDEAIRDAVRLPYLVRLLPLHQ